jgi:hypothetical protein
MLVLRLTEQNVHVVDLLNQCNLSVIEEQVLQQELKNVRNQTAKKENESRQMVLKCNGAKVLLHFFSPIFYVITDFLVLRNKWFISALRWLTSNLYDG